MTSIILVVTFLALFGLAYITKRRYGVLGLGLTAGYVLSDQVSREVAGFLQYVDFPVGPLSHVAVAQILLILAPALLLMIAGPKYLEQRQALIAAAIFAVFGTFLLMVPIVTGLPTSDPALTPYLSQVARNSSLITALSVALAVFDLMQTHGKKLPKKSKH